MNHVLYSVPTAALFAFALVSAAVPSTQEPREASSTLRTPPAFQDGAQDACVQNWDELLRLFDRGDKDQIRQRLCNDGTMRKEGAPAAALQTSTSHCIATSAVAFIEGAEENDSATVTGADAIVDRLCTVWPPLTKAETDAANRSKIVKSFVLDEGTDRKIYLLTIERPATAKNDEKTTFCVSAVVCGQPVGTDPLRRGTDETARPTGAPDPARTGGGADSSAWTKTKSGGGKLIHLHVSSAN